MPQISTLKLSKNATFSSKYVYLGVDIYMSTHFQINMNTSVWWPGNKELIYFGQFKIELVETTANEINNI